MTRNVAINGKKWLARDVSMALVALVAQKEADPLDVIKFETGQGLRSALVPLVGAWLADIKNKVEAEVAASDIELEAIFAEQDIRKRRASGWQRRKADWDF